MGWFRKLSGLLGLARDDHEEVVDVSIPSSSGTDGAQFPAQHLRRKGFGVSVEVPVDRVPPPPLLLPCPGGDGGLQGLRWHGRRLRIDEDGDVADEFLNEISPDITTTMEHNKPLPRFEVKYSTKPARVRNQALLPSAKIQHHVEYQGRLEWV